MHQVEANITAHNNALHETNLCAISLQTADGGAAYRSLGKSDWFGVRTKMKAGILNSASAYGGSM